MAVLRLSQIAGLLLAAATVPAPAQSAQPLQIPGESRPVEDVRGLQTSHWTPVEANEPLTRLPTPAPAIFSADERPSAAKASSKNATDPVVRELTEPNAGFVPPGVDPALPPRTLAELEQIALAKNPTLVQARMLINSAEGQRIQVGLYPNPTLNYIGDEMGDLGTAGQQGAAFGQEIVTTGKLAKRQAVAAQEIAQAQAALSIQQFRVCNAVKIHWFEVLKAQRAMELHEQLYQIGLRGVEIAEKLFAAQEVSRVDVLQMKIEAESAKVQLVNARNNYQAAWRRMTAVLGDPCLPPSLLAGALDAPAAEFEFDDALNCLIEKSPQLAQARAGVRRARANVTSQVADRLPNVELRGGVRYMSASQYTIGMMEVGSEIPVYSRNQGNIVKAEAELVSACKEVERLELLLRQRLATTFQAYANAKQESYRYASEIVPNAKESLELLAAGYNQGEFGYLTLLTAQRTYFRVSLEYLDALLAYQTSAVELDGLLLTGGLSKVDAAD